MAEKLSLKELKAENAALEAATTDAQVENKKEIVEDEYVEVKESNEVAVEEESESNDANDEEAIVEDWMQTEDAETSEDDHKSGFVPNQKAADRRKKAKALKGELKDTKDENEELRERLAALEAGNAPQAPQEVKLPARPTREQFDYDDDAYDAAVDDWNDKKLDLKLKNHTQTSQQEASQQQQAKQAQEAQDKHVSDHYERAQKLVDDNKITAESYQNADKVVRMTVDNIFKGRGDNIVNGLIATLNNLGEGSEKVLYQLGVNPSVMGQFQNMLINDPTGMAASAYLGKLQANISTPKKRRSQAPTPGSKVDGEGGQGGKFGTLQKQYNKLEGIQERISFKRKAKKDGVDVTKW